MPPSSRDLKVGDIFLYKNPRAPEDVEAHPHIVVARRGINLVCVSTSSRIEKVKTRCQRAEHIKSNQSPNTFVSISPLDCDVDKECAVDCSFAFVTEIFKIVKNPSFKLLASSGINSEYIDKIIFGIQCSRMIGEEIRKYLR